MVSTFKKSHNNEGGTLMGTLGVEVIMIIIMVIINVILDPLTYILENRGEVQEEGFQLVLPVSATHISSGATLRNSDS